MESHHPIVRTTAAPSRGTRRQPPQPLPPTTQHERAAKSPAEPQSEPADDPSRHLELIKVLQRPLEPKPATSLETTSADPAGVPTVRPEQLHRRVAVLVQAEPEADPALGVPHGQTDRPVRLLGQ